MSQPYLWVIAGPNGAGKSTLARKHFAGRVTMVNPDDIAQNLAATGRRGTALEAGRVAIKERERQLAARHSFGIETTLTGRGELDFMRKAAQSGYKVNLIFIGIDDPALSRMRVASRVEDGGHNVPASDINRRHDRSIENIAAAMEIADRAFVLDNSGPRPRLLCSQENQKTKYLSRFMPSWAKAALPVMAQNMHRSRGR